MAQNKANLTFDLVNKRQEKGIHRAEAENWIDKQNKEQHQHPEENFVADGRI